MLSTEKESGDCISQGSCFQANRENKNGASKLTLDRKLENKLEYLLGNSALVWLSLDVNLGVLDIPLSARSNKLLLLVQRTARLLLPA